MFDISIDYTLASVFEPWGFPPSEDKRAETSKIYLLFIALLWYDKIQIDTYSKKIGIHSSKFSSG